jgi:hypothetical protein
MSMRYLLPCYSLRAEAECAQAHMHRIDTDYAQR